MAKTAVAKAWSLPVQLNGARYSDPLLYIPAPAQPTVVSVTTSSVTLNAVAPTWPGGTLTQCEWFRDGVLITPTPVSFGNFTDSGRAQGTSYSYTVRARGPNSITGVLSVARIATTQATDTTAPSVPTLLPVNVISGSRIDLTWTASTDTGGSGLAGYKLERSSTSATTGFAQIYAGTGLSHSDQTVAAGVRYWYRLRAYDNAANDSAYSATQDGTTPTPVTGPVWQTGTITLELARNIPYSLNLATLCTGALSFSVQSGTLPTGLSLDPATGIISGTPTTTQTVAVTFRASDQPIIAVPQWSSSPVL